MQGIPGREIAGQTGGTAGCGQEAQPALPRAPPSTRTHSYRQPSFLSSACRPGRRMRTKHKEPDILAALDGACSKVLGADLAVHTTRLASHVAAAARTWVPHPACQGPCRPMPCVGGTRQQARADARSRQALPAGSLPKLLVCFNPTIPAACRQSAAHPSGAAGLRAVSWVGCWGQRLFRHGPAESPAGCHLVHLTLLCQHCPSRLRWRVPTSLRPWLPLPACHALPGPGLHQLPCRVHACSQAGVAVNTWGLPPPAAGWWGSNVRRWRTTSLTGAPRAWPPFCAWSGCGCATGTTWWTAGSCEGGKCMPWGFIHAVVHSLTDHRAVSHQLGATSVHCSRRKQ